MMQKMVIKVESWVDTLNWSQELARMIDAGEKIPESCVRSFEEPGDLQALFTSTRRELLTEVLRSSGSIDELSTRLQRTISELKHDVSMLVDADILTFDNGVVRPVAETVVFEPIPQLATEA